METIKIIRGTYGFKHTENGVISPKTVKDPPFEVDNKEAERLIALGVAACAEKEQADNGGNPLYNKSMSLKDLHKIAEEKYGVENASKITSKDKVIAAIEEVVNERV